MTTLSPAAPPIAHGDRFEALVERAVASVLSYRHALYLGPLALALVIAAWRAESAAAGLRIAGAAALSAVWYLRWIRTSWARPLLGRPAAQGLFTIVGAALLGLLVRTDFAFVLVCVPFMPRFFLTMPLHWSIPAATMVLVPVDLAFRDMTLHSPAAYGWTLVMRLAVVAVLGVMLRSFAVQAEQRHRLTEQLAGAERRAGQLEERQRIARDIHDTLAQGFAGIVVHLETAALERARDPRVAVRHADAALTVARRSLEEARRMMGAMLPEALDGRDLGDAVARVAGDWSSRTAVPCEAVVTGDARPLDRDVEVALLRVAQEALTNVWKHARATQVTVTLSYLDDVVLLDVRDDGVGTAVADPPTGAAGLGLAGMRARIEQLGGTFAVESAADEGTTVSASLPAIPADTAAWPVVGGAVRVEAVR